MRRQLTLCGGALLLIAPMPAQAQAAAPEATETVSESQSVMLLLSETFDGTATLSLSQRAGVGRAMRGDQSWTLVNYDDGSVVERDRSALAAGRIRSISGTELGIAYNRRWQVMSGDDLLARFFNIRLRPLIEQVPVPDGDARWQIRLMRASFGLGEGAIAIDLSRRSLTANGRALILTEYDLPAFSYRADTGDRVAQWGRGAALTDRATGELLWSSSLHRAVAQPQVGQGRPYRYALTGFAVRSDGQMALDPQGIAAMQPVLAAYYGRDATAPLPMVGADDEAVDQSPLKLAALMDLYALAVGQGGASAETIALGGFVLGRTGESVIAAAPQNTSGGGQ
jgi:hypothetical protein